VPEPPESVTANAVSSTGTMPVQAEVEAVARLARMVVLAVAIGNVDLHAKDLALLHPFDAPAILAPAYDTVPLRHQPNDGRMAFAVNGLYRHADRTIDDLEAQLGSWSAAA
jgi:serine/threonine-protein kinase HipA